MRTAVRVERRERVGIGERGGALRVVREGARSTSGPRTPGTARRGNDHGTEHHSSPGDSARSTARMCARMCAPVSPRDIP